MVPKKKDQRVNLKGFFEKGFEAQEFKNLTDYNLPVQMKYMSHDEFNGRFGKTYRYYLQDSDGEDVRLLCKGETFKKAIEEFVSVGEVILISKDEKNRWMFDFP